MELKQPIIGIAVPQDARLSHIELNGMAVIDDRVGALVPYDAQGRQLGADEVSDVERRLLQPGGAGAVGGVEIAPVGGTASAFIAPMGIGGARVVSTADRPKIPRAISKPGDGAYRISR